MRRGVSRGIFSNEAGIGTGSIAHACADTDEPVKQGMFGIFEVFADTIVICTLTALVILCGGEGIQYGVAAGAELTISGFVTTYGSWVTIFTAIAMCCFAFSTILGWGLYGARCVEFVFTTKVVKPFMIVYALVAILGATVDLGIIWGIADTCNGLMSIPNLIALFLLSYFITCHGHMMIPIRLNRTFILANLLGLKERLPKEIEAQGTGRQMMLEDVMQGW